MKIQKKIRKLRAIIFGTFVTDCPFCHTHFYGFSPYGLQVKISDKNYRIICHRCNSKHTQKTALLEAKP